MAGTSAAWGVGPAGPGEIRGRRTVEVLGAWYERSWIVVGRGYQAWYDPVIEDLIDGVLARADIDEDLVRLGTARAHAGYDRAEGMADLGALAAVLPSGVHDLVDGPEAWAAFCAGFDAVGPESFPRARLFGDADDLRSRLADVYGWDTAVSPADTHALLAVAIEGEYPAGRGVHAVGNLLAEHFGNAERVAWLDAGRFAVIVRRHPGLAVGIAGFEAALAAHVALEGIEVRMGLETLPATRAGLARLVQELVDGVRPRRQANDERLALTLVDTPRFVGGPDPSTPWQRSRRRLAAAWAGGLSLVSASVAVVLVAVGVAQVIGPAADRLGGTTLFGPALEFAPPATGPGTPEVAVAPFSEARGAAAGEPVVEPPVEVIAPEPVAAVAPAPPEPALEPPVAAAPQEAKPPPPPDPCAGVEGGQAVACERHQEVQPPGRQEGRPVGQNAHGDPDDRGRGAGPRPGG